MKCEQYKNSAENTFFYINNTKMNINDKVIYMYPKTMAKKKFLLTKSKPYTATSLEKQKKVWLHKHREAQLKKVSWSLRPFEELS